LHVAASELDWRPPTSGGEARLQWRAASATYGETRVDLGTVNANAVASGDRVTATVDAQGGDVAISGNASVDAAGNGQAALTITPRREDEVLVRALDGVGRRDGASWRVDARWSWR